MEQRPDTIPNWLKIAKEELGQKEVYGKGVNPRIREYHSSTKLNATSDDVPWCSAFVSWCMMMAGYDGTHSAAARSWESWGEKLDEPKLGCIVVMSRGRNRSLWQGHVGFYIDKADDKNIYVLGGNQNDRVCIDTFPKNRVLSYRWPSDYHG